MIATLSLIATTAGAQKDASAPAGATVLAPAQTEPEPARAFAG